MSEPGAPVLAVLEQPAAAAAVLAAAGRLAGLLGGAGVRVLAVRVPAEAGFLPSEEVLTDRHKAAWEAQEAARHAALCAAYDASALAGSGTWVEQAGDPAAIVAAQGRAAAMLVLASPGGARMSAGLHAALFDTGRPVLVVPGDCQAPFGRRVAIAWQDDGRAGQAMAAARPVLREAEHVVVLNGDGEPCAALAEAGIAATSRPVRAGAHRDIGAALLDAARDEGADLLVMGAYAHSRWREMVLGGVTRHVLAAATIPVLLRH